MASQDAPRHPTVRLGHLVRQALRRHESEIPAGPLVLAVSGGADSMAMLLAAAHARRALRRELIVAHFSHGIRRTAERGEARLVQRTAAQLDAAYEHEQAYLSGDEATAREARYAFFGRVARRHDAAAVLTAHTRDDQAETLLLRLARGSGLRGAGAVRELSVRNVDGQPMTLLRPLLGATRADTVAVCHEWNVTPASDGTNRSLRYARNRIRRRVLPDLAAINPEVIEALAGFAEDVQQDEDALQQAAAIAIGDARTDGDGWVEWPTAALTRLPWALTVRVLQAGWARLHGDGSTLSRRQIASIQQVLQRGSGAVDLDDGFVLAVEQDRTTLRQTQDLTPPSDVALLIPGTVRFGRWTITASRTSPGDVESSPWTAVLDAHALGAAAMVRTRRRGDRFHPLGMNGEVHLQDVLVNAKVPRTKRDAWPLVASEHGIAWVCGVRIAEWAKVTERTTDAVRIVVSPAGES